MSDQDELLTTDEIAKILKVEARTVRAYITQGKLAAIYLEGKYRVYRRDFDEFLKQRYKSPEKQE